jgi:short-subunit dehydrogenase
LSERVSIRGARTLLTGASGGIGGAIARRLAQEGAALILTGRRAAVLDALAAELGAQAIVADLSRPGACEQLLAQAGHVDILIANAALPASGRLVTVEQARAADALTVNLGAPIALAHGLAEQMIERRSGQIVLIGSLQSRAATSGASVYCATKFGMRGFALSLRAELAGSGVGVSIVMPGFVSEAGLYADAGVKLPFYVGSRRPDQVADGVVRAIREDRAEIVVAPPLLRAGSWLAHLAPELSARATRLLGGERIAREFERAQSQKR